ncbi:hypothetical protein DHW03_10645 [Pedobacter yonginense]|uniref:Outer membrane protein beta-barrel domain-containing protein n=1 Tax=Pedobacter yonginense TaxID=651869 RepID=A0A317EMA5_9SPHI|nr:hypothetical protein [Pedobacter yonginense]PWS28010.1 hypothetical protein DHW03_10645 [Pedobacter yonginense]
MSYTDVNKGKIGYTTTAAIDAKLLPFISFGLEGQYGLVKGGDINSDPHNRQFSNQYLSYTANGKIILDEVFDSDFVRGLYFGAGVGLIQNKITQVVRYKPDTEVKYPPLGYLFPGQDKSINIVVPANLGFNFFISDVSGLYKFAFNANAQLNYTFGEGLDGYNDPEGRFKNNKADQFFVFSVGIKYLFGR